MEYQSSSRSYRYTPALYVHIPLTIMPFALKLQEPETQGPIFILASILQKTDKVSQYVSNSSQERISMDLSCLEFPKDMRCTKTSAALRSPYSPDPIVLSFCDISENDGLCAASDAQQLSIKAFHSGSHHVGIWGRKVLFTMPPRKMVQEDQITLTPLFSSTQLMYNALIPNWSVLYPITHIP
ncbi:hypothetical protein Cgig2_033797 [Carnegiea gigantea]|uniref:Uncharacterized protein n=1 Tax=Carnegiea gigantea TaxID=171969 RepID=A0A9Q1JMS3_9CARY|nr:hypothetical protein Cgig2_033797 [Carnegiea gigantea]